MKIKSILRIILEIVLICLVCIIAFGMCYELKHSPGEFKNTFKAIRALVATKTSYVDSGMDMDGPVLWDSANQISNEEKTRKSAIPCWIYTNIKIAVNEAPTIFRGKVLSRSTETRGLPYYRPDGSIDGYEYYREVTVEVVDMIKGDKTQETILYKEPGGETESLIYTYNDIEPLNIGQEYIFFLYENNTFINPSTVMAISDEKVRVSVEMCPDSLRSKGENVVSQVVSADAYMKAVRQTFLYVMVIKVLVHVVGIGVVGAIFYFICRNLFKTTKFIVYKVKKKVIGSGL